MRRWLLWHGIVIGKEWGHKEELRCVWTCNICRRLDALTVPLTQEELDKVISKIPPDKAPCRDDY
jgi:hypothetical protein